MIIIIIMYIYDRAWSVRKKEKIKMFKGNHFP